MQLTLYHFQSCSYCARVRDFLSKEGIQVAMKDTHENPAYREELIKIGGKPQVPCLVIDGKALYESQDIIEWFSSISFRLNGGSASGEKKHK